MISCHIPRTFLNIYELWQVHIRCTDITYPSETYRWNETYLDETYRSKTYCR